MTQEQIYHRCDTKIEKICLLSSWVKKKSKQFAWYIDLSGGKVLGSNIIIDELEREISEELKITLSSQIQNWKQKILPIWTYTEQTEDDTTLVISVYEYEVKDMEWRIDHIQPGDEHKQWFWINSDQFKQYESCIIPGIKKYLDSLINLKNMMSTVSCLTLSQHAILPSRTYPDDAWYDLYSPVSITLSAGAHQCIMTDIAIQLPDWYFGWIAPRSGLASKYAIHVLGGIIDHGYTGNIGVILINLGNQDVDIQAWDRIAQLIVMPYLSYQMQVAIWQLDSSMRSDKWLGSSGS